MLSYFLGIPFDLLEDIFGVVDNAASEKDE